MSTEDKPTVIQLCAFLKRHGPWFRRWPREKLVPYIEWYWKDGRVGVVREDGKIVAAAIARCIKDVSEGDVHYRHHPDGQIVWVEDIVSLHPDGVAILLKHAMEIFGRRLLFAGKRFVRNGELQILPWSVVERLTRG
jgi:hypothetical protein